MNWIADYFNLNRPVTAPWGSNKPRNRSPKDVRTLTRSDVETKNTTKERKMPWWEQGIMYAGTAVGVFFSDAVNMLISRKSPAVEISVTSIVLSLVIGLAIIPVAYKALRITSQSLGLFRFGFFLANGILWKVILDLLKKAITGA
jgi:hypothetical protein